MNFIKIENKYIGHDYEPFIIAEMSGNHNGSIQKALDIVDAASETGAHALKLQTYTADTMTLNLKEREFVINDPTSLWYGYSLYELYKKAHTPWKWHEEIFKRCKEKGLICFSSPFDSTAVDFLEELNCPAYKIASFENTDLNLIKKVALTKKPLIISTGLATISDLEETVRTARENGCQDLILLKCTSSYPASPRHSNLKTIPHLRNLFNVQVGLSDHTLGIGAATASIAFGATVIEKHFTINRSEGGVDSKFSLEPDEFKQLVQETKTAWEALGEAEYRITSEEEKSLIFKRSLYVTKDLKAGNILTEENIKSIRPGLGVPVKFYNNFIGKKTKIDVLKGTPLSWDLIEN